MNRKLIFALLFLAGFGIGLERLYHPRAPRDSTPPGLRELMLGSISAGSLDLTRLRLANPWDRVCLLPGGTTDSDAHKKLSFLSTAWKLGEFSEVGSAPVTAVLLFGGGTEPVGVADLPSSRIKFDVAGGACLARSSARFPAN